MSRDHAKREIITGDKAMGSGRTLSRESSDKYMEESSSSIKSHRKGDKKKKKMKKVVYYETNSSSPSTSGAESTTSTRHERKKYSKMPLRYPRIPSVLLYFWYPYANHHILMVKIIVCGVIN
jgi:hypothetical protein